MSDSGQQGDRQPRPDQRLGHEARDANPKWVALAALGVLALVVVSLAGMYGLLSLLTGARSGERPSLRARRDVSASAQDGRSAADLPNRIDRASQRAFRERQQSARRRELQRFAWVDRAHGIARIPIDRAIELIGRHGDLPTWPTEEVSDEP